MEDELGRRLAEAAGRAARLKKIKSMLAELQKQSAELTLKVSECEAALAKENLDAQKLEGSSLAAVFYSVIGTIDERRDKERSEALAAKLKLDEAQSELEALRKRIKELQRQREELAGCEEEYARLYELKKQTLLSSHGSAAQSIMELTEAISRAEANIKEIGEALAAGENALYYLDSARASLGKARGWGTYDLLGGGFIAGMIKHDHMDEAANAASSAQIALNNFKSELADVHIESELNIQFEGFGRFADLFFDGLIADWYAQGRIDDSLQSVESAGSEVSIHLSRLKTRKRQEQESILRRQAQLDALIVGPQGGSV